jgi:hypothetical protein
VKEELGVETVRTKLMDNAGIGPGTEVKYIVESAPHPSRTFVEDWPAEQATVERRHMGRMDHWTIAAVTGVVAVALIMWS